MHRTDHPTATESNLFTDGNPSTNMPATTVDASWLNAVQETIVAPIEEAGISLVKGDNTQLLQAIIALIATETADLAPLASPALSGTPTAPTPASSDNSTRLATTAWVRAALLTLLGALGMEVKLAASGYLVLPALPGQTGDAGRLALQWVVASSTCSTGPVNSMYETDNLAITWAREFAAAPYGVLCGVTDVDGIGQQESAWVLTSTASGGSVRMSSRTSGAAVSGCFLAIGRVAAA